MKNCHLGEPGAAAGIGGRLRKLYRNSDHRWMYNYGLMASLLTDAGFTEIRRYELHDCEDEMFKLVEECSRFDAPGYRQLAIEARQPRL